MKKIAARSLLIVFYCLIALALLLCFIGVIVLWKLFLASAIIALLVVGVILLFCWAKDNA